VRQKAICTVSEVKRYKTSENLLGLYVQQQQQRFDWESGKHLAFVAKDTAHFFPNYKLTGYSRKKKT